MGASASNSYDKENKNPAAFMGTGVVNHANSRFYFEMHHPFYQ
jgi:hypothetical protein